MTAGSDSAEKPRKKRTATRSKSADATGAAPARPRAARSGAGRRKTVAASKTPAADAAERRGELPTDEQIAVRAFEIWERQGRPEGQQEENWLQAERELAKVARG